ncbi:MAG: YbaK/EbsC family protein [Clostridia bacterium]|jgi:prolyl-tRNA editing enzyme YbaK/EbsC (Cys-tRNA(Pro) deacylase)|nr:YbaK/EbsC family protein [Clostridia bacterium]
MAIENVRAFLAQFGMEGRILESEESSATVALAAIAFGTEERRIAKTLSFLLGDRAILVVAAGDAKVSNQKFRAQFGAKAKMLTPQQVHDMVGHDVGGVCPFAINDGVDVFLDESLRRFPTVFPACGSSNSAIELTLGELERLSGSKAWVDVCKLPEEG